MKLNDVTAYGTSTADMQVGDYVRFYPKFGRLHEHWCERFWKITEIDGDMLRITNSSGHRDIVQVAPHTGVGILRWNGSEGAKR